VSKFHGKFYVLHVHVGEWFGMELVLCINSSSLYVY